VLNSGAVLNPKHGHLTYGYCQTSHSSQSKSVRDVLIAQSADSFLASSREQFYVSVSRAKQSIRIYTDDRRGLQAAVGNSSLRRTGLELAGIGTRDVSSLMNDELNSRQFTDWIKSRKAENETHVERLMKERQQDKLRKPENMGFREYVEMRRKNGGAEGLGRSRDLSKEAQASYKVPKVKTGSLTRPTTLTDHAKERLAANKLQDVPAQAQAKTAVVPKPDGPKEKRLAKAYQSGVDHFKNFSNRTKAAIAEKRRPKALPESHIASVSKHARKERAQAAHAQVKLQAKVQTKNKVQAPKPAPVAQKGR